MAKLSIIGQNFAMKVRYYRVAMVREKSGKIQSFSESGKSQGILMQVSEFCNLLSKSGKVREFRLCSLSIHIFHRLANEI